MAILSVFSGRVPRPAATRPKYPLSASVIGVGGGGAVTAVVATVHRLLDRFLCSPPGIL
jgi:hypothetical protein